MTGKLIIISAPSGSGKSTIIHAIEDHGEIEMKFSVSATNRAPRQGEVHGVHYYFLTTEEFRDRIASDDFVEYEEVYPGRFYGTLKSEIKRRLEAGDTIILDIDVNGGLNVKKLYGDRALSIFIMPPSIEALRERLVGRATESASRIDERLARAEYEISLAPEFDEVIVNDNLAEAVAKTEEAISRFIKG